MKKYKGKSYVDIREYYKAPDGELKPTKKGAFLNKDSWETLKTNVDAIDEMIKQIENFLFIQNTCIIIYVKLKKIK